MRFYKKDFFLTAYLVIGTLVLISVLIPPKTFWPAIVLGYLIPLVLVSNLLVALWLLFMKRNLRSCLYAASLLLVTVPFWRVTVSLSQHEDHEKSISLLSYNVKLFREPDTYDKFSKELIRFVKKDTADIKCLQEFSTNARWPALDVKQQILNEGYQGFTMTANAAKYGDHSPGMAIFSKFPLLDSGIVLQSKGGINGIIYADVLIDTDTLRLYNVHLSSYQLSENKAANFLHRGMDVLRQGVAVVREHSKELEALQNHVLACKVPYIIAGDFNESPYSYHYFQLRKWANAFEKKGSGFGWTLVKPPLFARIDHIFFGGQVQAHAFVVENQVGGSDHYPIYFNFSL
ncbi:MAG: endonuclease/exonuclease/phosphatase family protein [Bacteroidota bacterium]